MDIFRRECTDETPYDGEGKWFHPKAKQIKSDDVYLNWYLCPICEKTFAEEVPD